jgi:Cu(I)/Ag(I) efflux system membrane fusion protein
MNKKTISYVIAGSILLLVLAFLIGRITAPNAGETISGHDHLSSQEAASKELEIWTCSMHPQIQLPEPGACPICGMDLIPLVKGGGGDDGPRTLSMSESSRALADIQTTVLARTYPVEKIHLVGKLEYDETKVKSLTARFPARIDELFVNFTGVGVAEGDDLAKVYSPELLTAQRELLTAHASNPESSIARVAREKLRLWDLLPDQIDEILERGGASDQFVLRAPVGGVVVSKNVKEGDYMKTGDPLFTIVDLSRLWLYLDAYESDLPWLHYAQDVEFTVEAFPGEIFHGQIAFIEPEVNRKTRTVSVRVNVSNTNKRLKPGMFARGVIEARMAEGGKVFAPELAGKWISPMHPEIIKDAPGQCDVCGMDLVPAEELGYVEQVEDRAPLIVPASAVLRTGKRAVVYIEIPDTERPTYEGREIVLGPRAGDYFLVSAGLAEGDRVVTQGAFKIDSSLQIQAKPSMMNPEGGGPVPGHNHGGHDATAPMQVSAGPEVKISGELGQQILAPYLKLQSALAADDLQAAKDQAKAIMEITGHQSPVAAVLHQMVDAQDLDGVRRPHFETLSNALIQAVKETPAAFSTPLYQINCFMAYPDRGADWLQATETPQNPYLGTYMLNCGVIKETINGTREEGR